VTAISDGSPHTGGAGGEEQPGDPTRATAEDIASGFDDQSPRKPSAVSVVLAVLGAVVAGVSVSYGLARHDHLWLLLGAFLFAPLLVVAAHVAAATTVSSPRAAGLAAMCVLLLIFVVTVVVVEPWWGARADASSTLYIPSHDPRAAVYLHAKPGSGELDTVAPLRGGHGYEFACAEDLGDGTRWFRLADGAYWVPDVALRDASGHRVGKFKSCSQG
jgi:hypothetical protein